MSKVKIQGHASGTGVLTVTAPNTSTDRTITLPDATGTLLNSDGSGANLTSLPNGSQLDHSGSKKIEATSTGVDVTGIAVTDGVTSSGNITFDNGNSSVSIKSDGANGSYIQFGSNEYLRFLYDNGASESIRLIDGGGITFNGDTAAANALDDYEEGEFDASFSSSGASFSYTARKGYYTKIGNRVFYNIYMQLDGSQTFTSNQVTITGLPFASNGGNHFNSSSICETRYVDFDSGFTALAGRIGANTTSILLLEIGDGQAGNVLRSDQLSSSSGQIFINGSYAI